MTRPKIVYGRQGLGWDCGTGGEGGRAGINENVTDTFSLLTVGPN